MTNQGADRIVQRIITEGRSRAEAIVSEAKQKAAQMISEAEKTAASQRKRALERTRIQMEEQKQRILGAAQLEARKDLLKAKQDIIDDVFKRALHELSNLDQDSYFQLLSKMLLATAEKGDETVILSPRDKQRIPAGFWEEINRSLKKAGKKGALAPAEETRDIPGGVILQAEGVELNSSFSALLEMHREELEPVVAALLFEGE
ncbi:MAG TPA: hypothetical protein GX693_08110 [Firmicutes bacterium]|nr:hypothetical protein [Bacillota bacterium]